MLVVACVVAAGLGYVLEAGLACGAGGEVADGGVGNGLAAGSGFLGVLVEGDVADVVLVVLDAPMLAGGDGQVAGSARSAGRLVDCRCLFLP